MSANTLGSFDKELQSTLSEVFPKFSQLLKSYDIVETLEVRVANLSQIQSVSEMTCCFHDGVIVCGETECNGISKLSLDAEKEQALSKEISSGLSTILPRLSQSINQGDEVSGIQFFIDPAITEPEKPLPCCKIGDNRCCAPTREMHEIKCKQCYPNS